VYWYFKTWLVSGQVTADLTTTVIHSSKLLINDIKSIHSLLCIKKLDTMTDLKKNLTGFNESSTYAII